MYRTLFSQLLVYLFLGFSACAMASSAIDLGFYRAVYDAAYRDYTFTADNHEYALEMRIAFSAIEPGTYTTAGGSLNYCYVYRYADEAYLFASAAETVISLSADTVRMEVAFHDSKGDEYTFHLHYYQVTETSRLELVMDSCQWRDVVPSKPWWRMQGYTADSTYYASFSNWADATSAPGTYDLSDLDYEYSLIRTAGREIDFFSGTVVVSVTDTTVLLDADMLAPDGVRYLIHMTHYADSASTGPLPYDPALYGDDESTDITLSYDPTTASLELDSTALYSLGVLDIVIRNSDESDVLSLEFYNPGPLTDGFLSDGEYPVAFASELTELYPDHCLEASPGVIFNMLFPSFYGTKSGNAVNHVWHIVEGVATVLTTDEARVLHLLVRNTKGAQLDYTFTLPLLPSSVFVPSLAPRATKRLHNGHLLIDRHGHTYTPHGSQL